MSLRSDDLDSVGELYTEDDFRQLVVTIETAPASLSGFGELEDHGQRGLVRETSLRAHGTVTHGCKRAFDDVRRAAWVSRRFSACHALRLKLKMSLTQVITSTQDPT